MDKKTDNSGQSGHPPINAIRLQGRIGPPREFDIAQVCLNGHLINLHAATTPQFNKKYCPECGQPVINRCQNCKSPIKGPYLKDDLSDLRWSKRGYCENCGKPFPWTTRARTAARKVTKGLELLSDEQKKEINKNIDDMAKNTPHALEAAKQFKKTLEEKYGQIPALYREPLIALLPTGITTFLGLVLPH